MLDTTVQNMHTVYTGLNGTGTVGQFRNHTASHIAVSDQLFCLGKLVSSGADELSEAKQLIADGYVTGGMIPKLTNCAGAIEAGVNRVHILDGRIEHCLLLEIFTNKGIGTAILKDAEEKYYKQGEEE